MHWRHLNDSFLPCLPLLLLLGVGVSVQAQNLSLNGCASQLEAQGFRVLDRAFECGLYEFEALKDGKELDIKTDLTCKVLLKHIDD